MPKKLRVPGIIGGAGPGATVQLYLDILARCRQAGLPRRPPVLIASLDIDLAMEKRLLLEGEGVEGYGEPLVEAARALAAASADFLALPCNTLHVLLPELTRAVPIPVLSIVQAVAREVEKCDCHTVGLLATATTVNSGLYQTGLKERGIEVVGLAYDLQRELEERIQAEVNLCGPVPDSDLERAIIDALTAQGAGVLIAGCTELKSLMAGWQIPVPVIDSLDALGAMVVQEMMASSCSS